MTVASATTTPVPGDDQRPRTTPLAVGVVVWLASELMFFAGLFAAYYVLRARNAGDWPPENVELDIPRAVASTVVLIASSATMHISVRAAEHDDRSKALRWMFITFLLGTAFVVNLGFEWAANDFSLSSSAYGSIYYLLTGAHGVHLVAGLALMIVAAVVVSGPDSRAPFGPAIQLTGYYWHFVDLVWVFVFTTIFLVQ